MARTRVNDVLTKEDWAKYKLYIKMLKRDLKASKLPKDRQKEIFNVLAYNEQMRMATNRIGIERNKIIDQQEAINKKYKIEPNDVKARQLAEEHKKLGVKATVLDKERSYFFQKFHETKTRTVQLDNELTEALIKQGYKIGKDGRARKSEDYFQSQITKKR